MERIYSKYGNISTLKEVISFLDNFTGIIKIDNAKLFYKNSKLILSTYNDREKDLEEIIKKLPKFFLIEIYRTSSNEIEELISHNKLIEKDHSVINFVEVNKLDINYGNGILINAYKNIFNYINGLCKVEFRFKKYKGDEGTIVYKDNEEILAIYKQKDKILEGKRALNKIKTIFAVSDVFAFIDKISEEELNKIIDKHPNAVLKVVVSFDELIKNIKSKEYKVVEDDSLLEVLTEEPSLIEIVGENAYIVSKNKNAMYAFLNDYDGDKAFRIIKNICILNKITFKIYPLTEKEFEMFKEFKKNRVKVSLP
ncbi:hypothetical protein [Methanotorris igneus]|uniref:Uncharacterized protein n=1 Tax=Methanotorris igneus (strain DSM 5666 / JCM 11834 / Kol 5) TaxID=880724 RepID=F6BDG2_METIK|nr:hypothetical protein [Methanotorris igneus]AEF96523.1 hypothetical protein Metig_0980 [Methanotorris igneus Kol 5]